MEDARKVAWSQTADKLIQFYGFGAENEAARQAETCARRGDMESSETWNWIARAIGDAQPRPDVETDATIPVVGLT